MKDIIHQFYNGILRFFPLKKYYSFKSSHIGLFPTVGFLTEERRKRLEEELGTTIHNKEIFEQALTHRSYLQILSDSGFLSNERLEFLGDSVLGMIIADYLFSLHTTVLEGELTKMRSCLVNKNALALAARKLNLEEFIMLSFSAGKSLNNGSDSILADALEAIIAAIYIDSGLETARKFIIDSLVPIMMDRKVLDDVNYKSELLEYVQGRGKGSPTYKVLDESGPDHDKVFQVCVYVENELLGSGKGKNKKQAEQNAAQKAMTKILNRTENYMY